MGKVIIHGSTIGTNFGDCLLAQIFYKVCKENYTGTTLFYDNKFLIKSEQFELSPFYKRVLDYHENCGFRDVLDCSGIIFMAGGYFGETGNGLKEALVRYYRYIKLGIYAIIFRKPIGIIGIEAGPISHGFLRRGIKRICNHSKILVVRNDDSADFLKSIGVNKPIKITADIAQILTKENVKPISIKLKSDIENVTKGRKVILLHCVLPKSEIEIIQQKIVPALKRVIEEDDYSVIISNDQCDVDRTAEMSAIAEELGLERCFVHTYQGPDEMISLLNYVDCVLTTKLHVGIVGSSLGKPVISFPFNANKITRYYSQIGYREHCDPIRNTTPDKAYEMIKKYKDTPIILPGDIRAAANENLSYLREFLSKL